MFHNLINNMQSNVINENTIGTVTTLKLASYPAIVWLFAYTGFNHEAVGILALLLVIDVITALIRVAVTDPTKLSSKIGIIGILSKCLTFIVPFVIVIVGKGAGLDMLAFANSAVTILLVYEGWSIIGNIGQIRSKDTSLAEYDAVSLLISKIQDTFKGILGNFFLSDKNNSSNSPEVPTKKVEAQESLD